MSYLIDFRRKVIFTMEERRVEYPRNSEAISDWLCICIALD
ncbi:hypothetical protein [Arsenophonus endosymbiont of Bemisia tabaci]|nr:hypothetical protein [Arsenophonus endosymbiont of Bemisia tabaci]